MFKSISGRITFNLVAGIVLTVLTVVGAVWWMATQHNRAATASTHTMVVGGVEAMTRRLQTVANDYSWWEEAYDAFFREDAQWIEDNVGTGITETEIADMLAIIAPDGAIAYGWTIEENPPVESLLTAETIQSIRALVANAPVRRDAAKSAYIRTPNGPMLIAVSRLAPVSRADSVDSTTLPLVVMAVYLSDERLGDLGETFLIDDLRFRTAPPEDATDAFDQEPIVDINGQRLGSIYWTPPQPGNALLRSVALPIGIALLLFCGIAVWTAVRARVMAMELARSEQLAIEASRTDSLTGLINRHGFNQLTEQLSADPSHERLGIIYLDINGFKAVNDSIGHHGGDDLVKALAQRFIGVLPPESALARVGGDEFAVVMSGEGVGDVIPPVAASLVHALDRPFPIGAFEFHVSAAVGYAIVEGHVPAEEALRRADLAMYQAKASGDREAMGYHPNMENGALEKKQVEMALRPALEAKELLVVYQPIVRASDRKIVGVEALARWPSKELGMVDPAFFISVAEETGLIHEVGRYVIEQACTDAANWPDLRIAVNVSPVQLRDPSFADDLLAITQRLNIDPDRLELELTEGILVKNTTLAKRKLDRLKNLGFQLSLDDFGTGFSSIGYLRQFPFDKLKIDRCFVRDIGINPTANALIQALVSLGDAMNLAVVAEGIETESQLDLLRLLRCEYMQGYFFSKAVPAEGITRLLQAAQTEPEPFPHQRWPAEAKPGAAA